jgi:ribosome maturation factor RimP
MDHRTRAEQIRTAVDRALAASGMVVEDVGVQAAGRRRVVRVTVARDVADLTDDPSSPVPPLSLDEVSTASRAVDEVLESGDLMGPAAYTLEVSSPGVDTPLTSPAQFRRNVGRLVLIQLADEGSVEGRLVHADQEGVRLSGAPETTVPYDAVIRATVQVEFTRHAEEDH